MSEHKPKLIVFDLDYTLWPFWVDTHVIPPFRKDELGKVYDKNGGNVKLYPDSLAIVKKLKSENYLLAVASRTGSIEEAESLLELFDINKYFSWKQIYPGRKTSHFGTFHNESGIPYEEMLFFDDEQRNITDLSKVGVTCMLVKKGMDWKTLHEGMELFQRQRISK